MLAEGDVVDKYRVESELGSGGMASVYRVRHSQLGSIHALKIVAASNDVLSQRLLREGKAMASLDHPNLVKVTDVLDLDGTPALVMEYVRGSTLHDYMSSKRLDTSEALELFRGIARGVRHAHTHGIIHRDLKPANVLLHRSDSGIVPKVADFGLAKALLDDSGGMTRTGTILGTPEYIAPEQIRDSKSVDHRCDLFSLGCILYEMLYGESPFHARDVMETFQNVIAGNYTPPEQRQPVVPTSLAETIKGLLQGEPGDRIPDCDALLGRLESIPSMALRAGTDEGRPWDPEGTSGVVSFVRDPKSAAQNDSRKAALAARTVAEPPPTPRTPRTAAPVADAPRAGIRMDLIVVALIVSVTVLAAIWMLTRPSEDAPAPAAAVLPEEATATAAQEPAAAETPAAGTPGVPAGALNVVVSGDAASVVLKRDGFTFEPSLPIPPGTYAIEVGFAGAGPLAAGQITVPPGGKVAIDCRSAKLGCTTGAGGGL